MLWSIVHFGKHDGKTLPQIVCSDPDWFFWAMANNVFARRPVLLREATDLHHKATHIRIPNNSKGELEVEYIIDAPTGKFSHFEIVPSSKPVHQGSSRAFRKSVIDMSVPRTFGRYDKLGCKLLITSFKSYLFGNESVRLTKNRCEAFFDNSENFI